MSAIDTYLDGIRNHDWASDVRDDIANAIEQCYSDVQAASTDIELTASNSNTQTIETINSVTFKISGKVVVLNCVFTTGRIVNSNGKLFSFDFYKTSKSDMTVPVFDNSGNVKFVNITSYGDITVKSTNLPIGTYTLNATWIR